MNVGAYVRVSTQEQAKEGYSIGEQIERLTKYCAAMEWTLYRVYTDPGFSGASTDRPGLQEMINDVQAGKLQKIVVYKLDRLSRSQLDTLYLIEKVFLANGCDFVSMNENFDTSTPFGRAMIGILAVFAQLEREQIKERLMMGLDARAKDGKWRGGTPPFGYDYENDTLRINEHDALIVKTIFEMFLAGSPLQQIETFLISKGFKQRGTDFSVCNLRYILSNYAYAGYIRYRSEWLPGTQEPIINEADIDAAVKKLEENAARYATTRISVGSTNYTTYLGGLIWCGKCGARYGQRRSSMGEARHKTYVCYSRSKQIKSMVRDPACKNKIYRADELDEIVFNEIRKLAFDPDYLPSLIGSADTDVNKKIRLLETELKSVDSQISRFMDLYGLGRFSVEQLDAKLLPLESQRTRLQAELKEISANKTGITEYEAQAVIQSFSDILEHGDFNEIRCVLETLIDKIVINDDDITIYWRFA